MTRRYGLVLTVAASLSGAVAWGAPNALLENYCLDCHDGDAAKGNVVLEDLGALSRDAKIDLLNRAQEQLYTKFMPPEDKRGPSKEDRAALLSWFEAELGEDSKLEEKLRYPHYANYVDHEKLFSGEVKGAPYTPARRWLVSPQIFHERVLDVFALEGHERNGKRRGFYGVNNPFILPDHSGVRDYDHTPLDGGHLLQMLSNAEWISTKQLRAEPSNPRDKWVPRKAQPAFEAIVECEGAPSDSQIAEAVRLQFDLVLKRPPSEAEFAKYHALARTAVELGGNTEGLRRMLVAVLLESEFLYRLEFGAGEPDAHGRRKLSPREASFAISYALGDRGPDPELARAAAEGRLLAKGDYRREVLRLLADEEYYSGQIDNTLDGKHYRSEVTPHPKIVRFFREFFGYAGSLKVFKDGKRAEGKYSNPGRGSQATPGWLTYEADKVVTLHVENDEKVFENLLTSDEFFVYHNMDNEKGAELLEEWRGVYEKLKGTAWRTEPERVLEENLEFLKAQKSMRVADASKPGELVNYMHFFEEHFGRGIKPFTRIPWSHGYTYHHSPFYSLPPTPAIGRYGSWKSTKLNEKIEDKTFWDYPTEQPFKIANRKGILTHPAWLIAHSTNFHSDPIRRGRWVREKLLAGSVPDVPITVDARVPDDPHKTFRDRVVQVTKANECWKCHKHMNPLGLAFEMYDDFGRYRTAEVLEHEDNLIKRGNGKSTFDVYPTAPVVTTGALSGTGDPKLDGEVSDALDLIDRLGRSERVRQSIIRHAFRFYMGRNEMLSDSKTLIDADRAYVESGGSFKAVIVSLLTSDSFIFRKDT